MVSTSVIGSLRIHGLAEYLDTVHCGVVMTMGFFGISIRFCTLDAIRFPARISFIAFDATFLRPEDVVVVVPPDGS